MLEYHAKQVFVIHFIQDSQKIDFQTGSIKFYGSNHSKSEERPLNSKILGKRAKTVESFP